MAMMKLWMYRRPETAALVEGEHGEDSCLHCEYVNEHVSCDALGVVFVCGDDGTLRRVEIVIAGTPRMLGLCLLNPHLPSNPRVCLAIDFLPHVVDRLAWSRHPVDGETG